ncbi:MAG: universal stress protein [Ardenticatenaceae bacterium]|nr:universal stress protein [Ardenticatenaceae bacterium]
MNALEFRTKKTSPPSQPGAPAAELWSVSTARRPQKLVQPAGLRLLSCGPADGSPALLPYANYLCHLLNGRLQHLVLPEQKAVTAVARAAAHTDLIILDEPEQSLAARLCLGRPGQKFAAQMPASVLVARQPLWPLRQLLLVLRLDNQDETAVIWAKRLAQTSGAAVTILPLVPSLPAMYAPRSNGVAALLSSQTAAGQQVRQVAKQLNEARITAVIHLRQGEPDGQISREIEAGLHDLVVIGAEPTIKWQRWLLGDLVSPLLSWITHPVLVAKPTKAT